uniref:Glutathione S-transferase T3-like n=1 Tax=Tanacetum cinerariifolium TaxID=118510 RepID=A0A6L2M0V2_TANCI|nr:glutathione S-transferase T3-like [Tanacetum cinerariifolium]
MRKLAQRDAERDEKRDAERDAARDAARDAKIEVERENVEREASNEGGLQKRRKQTSSTVNLADGDENEDEEQTQQCARWTSEEEFLLTELWIETFENGQIGADRNDESFWGQIMQDFNNTSTQGYRIKNMLAGKWTRINSDYQKLNAIYKHLERKSGENEVDHIETAKLNFAAQQPKGRKFMLEHAGGSASGSISDSISEELRRKLQAGTSAYEAKKEKEMAIMEFKEMEFLMIDPNTDRLTSCKMVFEAVMTLSGFGKDEILRILAWRPIAVAAMASVSSLFVSLIVMVLIMCIVGRLLAILSLPLSMSCDDCDGCVTIGVLCGQCKGGCDESPRVWLKMRLSAYWLGNLLVGSMVETTQPIDNEPTTSVSPVTKGANVKTVGNTHNIHNEVTNLVFSMAVDCRHVGTSVSNQHKRAPANIQAMSMAFEQTPSKRIRGNRHHLEEESDFWVTKGDLLEKEHEGIGLAYPQWPKLQKT